MTYLDASPALTGKANKIGYMPPPTTPTSAPLIRMQVGQFRSPTEQIEPFNVFLKETSGRKINVILNIKAIPDIIGFVTVAV